MGNVCLLDDSWGKIEYRMSKGISAKFAPTRDRLVRYNQPICVLQLATQFATDCFAFQGAIGEKASLYNDIVYVHSWFYHCFYLWLVDDLSYYLLFAGDWVWRIFIHDCYSEERKITRN